MYRVERIGERHLEIGMSGRLDDASMQEALDDIVAASEDIENGTMLYDVIDFHLPTLAAIRIEFARMPSMLGLMKRFRRAAVLTDKRWLRTVSEIEGLLVPNLEIRAFARNDRAAAEAWLFSKPESNGG
jgi:hypothetical protein